MLLLLAACSSGQGRALLPSSDDTAAETTLDEFFSPAVHALRLELSSDAIAALAEDPGEYVQGTVAIDDMSFSSVGVRIKGGDGSYVPIDCSDCVEWESGNGHPGKSAFIFDFDHYVPDQDLLGLERLTVNNMVQDPSGMHEYVGYALFRRRQVPASRATWAALTLNGEDRGLYCLVESNDNAEFLERWYGGAAGNLYEGEYGVDIVPDQVELFDQDNGDDESREDLAALAAALGNDDLDALIDLDEYLAFASAELFLGHWDGYAWTTNNYKLHHATSGQWTFIPWGIDQLLEDWLGDYAGVMQDPGLGWPQGGRVQALCMASADCRVRLHDAFAQTIAEADQGAIEEALATVGPLVVAEAAEWGDAALAESAQASVVDFWQARGEGIAQWLPCLLGEPVDSDEDGEDNCLSGARSR